MIWNSLPLPLKLLAVSLLLSLLAVALRAFGNLLIATQRLATLLRSRRRMFCSSCAAPVYDASSRWCTKCGGPLPTAGLPSAVPSSPQVMIIRPSKSPGVAAVLSVVWCGLGHIYNGKIGSGIMLMILYPVSAFASWVGLLASIGGSGSGALLIFAAPVVWIHAVVSAYRTAERINRQVEQP